MSAAPAVRGKRRGSSRISPVSRQTRIFVIFLALLALAAVAGLAWATALGPNGYSDSAAYLVAGRNLARGAGLGYQLPGGLGTTQAAGSFYTLTHYPPLYTLMFSLFTWLGLDLVEAGRWLNILALAGALFALGGLFRRFSSNSWLGAVAVVVLLAFPAASGVYASLMSDGLFLTLFLLSQLALLIYLRQPGRGRLTAATLLTAALPLTRYIGLVCVASSTLILFLFIEGPTRQRLMRTLGFGLAALLPIGLWLLWVYLGVDASLGGRGSVDGGILALLQQFRAYFTDALWAWIPFMRVPSGLPYWLRQVILLAPGAGALALALRLGRKAKQAPANGGLLFWTFAISGVAYLLGLAGAFVFTAPAPDISDRTLLPFFVCSLGTLLALAGWGIAQRPGLARLTWAAALLVGALFVAAHTGDTWEAAQELHTGQLGFFTQRWRASETMQAVRALPQDQILVADRAAALLYWADRPAYELLEISGDDLSLEAAQGDLLVVFSDFPIWLAARRGPDATARAAKLTAGLQPLQTLADGVIYSLEMDPP